MMHMAKKHESKINAVEIMHTVTPCSRRVIVTVLIQAKIFEVSCDLLENNFHSDVKQHPPHHYGGFGDHERPLNYRRQATFPAGLGPASPDDDADRAWSRQVMSPRPSARTAPYRPTVPEDRDCDYLTINCPRVYLTGHICARTIYFRYKNFNSYCDMDYINCRNQYEVWKIVYMGKCVKYNDYKLPHEKFIHYGYGDTAFMDEYYVDSYEL